MMQFLKQYNSTIAIFLIWLVVVNVFALIALNRLNLTADTSYSWIPQEYYQEPGLRFDVIHAQWDSFWILDIVENGYYLRGDSISNVVFFPLYPLLVKCLSIIFTNKIFAGWLISISSLFFALIFLNKLVKEFFPHIKGEDVTIFLLLFPTAYFFNTFYTESLFLFLSIATIYYAKRGELKIAVLFGFLAALTRVTGALLLFPVLWYVFENSNFNIKEVLKWKNACLFLIPIGTISFFLYHYIEFGNLFLFFDMESLWGRSFKINKDHFFVNNPAQVTNLMLDAFFVLCALIATFFVWKKIDRGMAIYMFCTVCVAVSTGTLMSIGRYILILFPIYIFAASIKNRYVKFTWLLMSCMLFTLYTLLFVNHYWAG